MEKINLNRQQLYDLVWSESLLSLSKKYAISDVGLRKICKRMNIPLPKAGHWQKIKVGKKVPLKDLPSAEGGSKEITFSLREPGYISKDDFESPFNILKREIDRNSALPLIVPTELSNPDKLILDLKKNLLKQRPGSITNTRGLVHSYSEELDMRVSPDNVMRALCFMDTFIKLLRARDHEIKLDAYGTSIYVYGERMVISFKEKMNRVLVKDKNYEKYKMWNAEYSPTGILALRLKYSIYKIEWRDGKLPLENQLSKILATIEIKGKELREENLRREERRKIEEENKRIQQELRKRQEADLAEFRTLFHLASRRKKAEDLRTYINLLESQALAKNSITEEFKNWIDWARKKIDWYDPLTHSEDELGEDVDMETLTLKKKSFFF